MSIGYVYTKKYLYVNAIDVKTPPFQIEILYFGDIMIVQSDNDDQGDNLQFFFCFSRSSGKNGKDMALCIGFFDWNRFWNSGWNHIYLSISKKVNKFIAHVS